MDVIKAIRTLRVVRSYRPQPLTEEELRAIVDAARKTGSSKNTQRWDFITLRSPETLAQLRAVGHYAEHVPTAGAAVALVVPKPSPEHVRSVLWDLGRAAQNMTLAAWAMGIGSCPVTVHDLGAAAHILGLPDDRQCEYIITFGRPADPHDLTRPPQAGGRKAFEDVVHDERW